MIRQPTIPAMNVQLLDCTFCDNSIAVRIVPGLHLPLQSCGHPICGGCKKIHSGDDCTICKSKTRKGDKAEQEKLRCCDTKEKVKKTAIRFNFPSIMKYKRTRMWIISQKTQHNSNGQQKKKTNTVEKSEFKKPKSDCRTFRHYQRWKITHALVRQNAFCGSWPIST